MVRANQRLPAIPQTTMMTSLNLLQCRGMKYDYGQHFSGNGLSLLRHGISRNCCLASHINPYASTFTSSVGSPPSSLLPNLTHRHILLLNFIACAAGISAACLFCSVIPTLLNLPSTRYNLKQQKHIQTLFSMAWLSGSDYSMPHDYLIGFHLRAFKRAAESLEKLLDVTREELPDTMAAIRLSGMEISDLTMELSDLGQEITQGVKSSTRAVHLAEERLRRLTNMNPSALMQVVVHMKPEPAGPVVARTARGIRENIVKSRAFVQMFFSITQFSKVAFKFLKSRAKSKA